ncbi:MAG: S9 family peptidase [Bacteroidales bacterium]|nr:S9 family peptidase [Bacteroidales bacterium]MCF8328355.1 S9 family peptidase [Bacteroidales bacterium]
MRKTNTTALIILALILGSSFTQGQDGAKITLADLWKKGTFRAHGVRGLRSMEDGTHYTTLEKRSMIIKHSYETGEAVDTLVNSKELDADFKRIQGYSFNADESKIMVYTNRQNIYRRSFTAEFYVIDLASNSVMPVSENGRQQLATFSPKGTKAAFVRDNNIFIRDLVTKEEKQITYDGEKNKIINGAPDWVYEEEFEFKKAFEWSPDGKKIAFMKFNESRVKEYSMKIYAGAAPHHEENDPYPEIRKWKYPKAGEKNSILTVHVYDLNTENTTEMDVGEETDQYIPRIRWTDNPGKLSIFRLNRLQNRFEILLANPETGDSEVMYSEKNEYFIDETNFDYITYLDDGDHFTLVSEMDGWNHLYLVDMEGDIQQKLTKGEYDITDYYGFDKEAKRFYFQAAKKSPLKREVYSVNWEGEDLKKVSDKSGTNSASFSNGFRYYINTFSDATTPPYISLHNESGKKIRVLEDNQTLQNKLDTLDHSLKEFSSFKTSEDVELNYSIIKPIDFDPQKQYPVLITQYSGPNSQSVRDSWSFGWNNFLAQEGYVVVSVDPRGTGARGEVFRKMTYKQLGHYETIDLIETAKYLGKKDFIDKDRIGIWGWSYGGFMTCLTMTKGEGVIDAGIAVAPVTNWRFYDNIYTERFMQKPQQNKEGYEENSPLNFADQLQGDLLLVHGSADDNVHLQNTMEFAERLVQANKQFDMKIYTNRNHGIYGGNTRYHLYNLMTDYLNDNLKN